MTSLRPSDIQTKRRARARLSASLLIVDRSEDQPRFLFGKRHESHRFMPGAHVFPGGRLDRTDIRQFDAPLQDQQLIDAALGTRTNRMTASALGWCALRETFEETGYLFGCETGDTPTNSPAGFAEHNLTPNLSGLRFLARAVTPPNLPLRYETYFFMVFREAASFEGLVDNSDSELSGLIWANAAETAGLNLPGITRMILAEAVQRLKEDPALVGAVPVPDFYTRNGKHYRSLITQ